MKSIKTREDIAAEYDITVRTLHRWLKKHLSSLKKVTLTPKYQKTIYNTFGYPPSVNAEAYAQVII